jgi:hypothetical protein
MDAETNKPEKKIIIDEDWKTQVEAEREAARQTESAAPSDSAAGGAADTSAGDSNMPLPAPDLSFLIGTLYLQGVIALGMMPNPVSGKIEVHKAQAKHTIDLLSMLQEKTEGNRTPDESADFDSVLHQLRLAFVGFNQTSDAKP